MIFHYLYEVIHNGDIDCEEAFLRHLAYIEKSAALDVVSVILDFISIAKEKGLTLEDIEQAITDLYNEIMTEKFLLVKDDPILSTLYNVIKAVEKERKTQVLKPRVKEPGQASI